MNNAKVVLDGCAILDNFTERTRQNCFGVFLWRREEKDLASPAPEELRIMDKLGNHVAAIMMELLPRWTNEMIKLNKELPFTRAIEESPDNIQIIKKYTTVFKHEWEEVFGSMDGTDALWLPHDVEPPFYHSLSTGDAARKFFGAMLRTRLQAMEKRRLEWRQIISFEEIPLKKLPEDVKDCHICQQPLGVPDEDGEIETPIRVVACCGNYFGANCLRRWYGEFENAKCPLCKWTASTSFLEKLCYEATEDGLDVGDDLDKESAIAHMGSVRAPTPDVDDDLEDGETNFDPYGLGDGEVYDDEDADDGLEDGEIRE
jgi:hypothetical protein